MAFAELDEQAMIEEENGLRNIIYGYGTYDECAAARLELARMRRDRGVLRLEEGVVEDDVPANWTNLIVGKLQELNLASPTSCVLGITFGQHPEVVDRTVASGYVAGRYHLHIGPHADLLGFEKDHYVDYSDLETAWKEYLYDTPVGRSA